MQNAHIKRMKKAKTLFWTLPLLLLFMLLCGCNAQNAEPLKTLTKPYIATYTCTQAKFGEDDFLDKFEYVKIRLIDKETFALEYKTKQGEQKAYTFPYQYNPETHQFSADCGVLGAEESPYATLQDGKLTVIKQIGNKTLCLVFENK